MPIRTLLWRAVLLGALVVVVAFGAAALAIAARNDGPTAGAGDETDPQSALRESSTAATTLPIPTAPPTTEAPPAAPPEPEPEPEPEPAPPARTSTTLAPREVEPAPAPSPVAVASSCQGLSGGGLIAAQQGIHPFSVDGGLSAAAQGFAFTLCNAHAEGNLFHSGQASGENVAWIYSSGGCMNDGATVVQYWMNSPGHRANIEQFNVVGAGVACDGNNTYFVAQYR